MKRKKKKTTRQTHSKTPAALPVSLFPKENTSSRDNKTPTETIKQTLGFQNSLSLLSSNDIPANSSCDLLSRVERPGRLVFRSAESSHLLCRFSSSSFGHETRFSLIPLSLQVSMAEGFDISSPSPYKVGRSSWSHPRNLGHLLLFRLIFLI